MGITITNPVVDPFTFLFTEPAGAGPDQIFTVDVTFTFGVHSDGAGGFISDVSALLEGKTANFGNRNRFNQDPANVDISVEVDPLSLVPLLPGNATVTFDVPFKFYNRVAHNEHVILKTLLTITDDIDSGFDTIQIWVDITGRNDKPTAKADSVILLDKFTTYTFTQSTFLKNDDDPDVVPTRDVFTITSVAQVGGFTLGPGTVLPPEFVAQPPGTVKLQGGKVVVTLNDYYDFLAAGESIQGKIKYTMNDGHAGGDSSAFVTFTLKGGATAIFAGNNAANQMLGENDKDTMDGNGGNDTIFARGGNDILIGDAGNDKFTGGLGADQYFTGTGKDIVFINAANETGKTAALRDKFMDFVRGQDKINVAKIDANTAVAGDQGFEFIGTTPFGLQNAGDAKGQLRFDNVGKNVIVVQGDIGHNNTVDFTFQINGIAAFQDFFVL